MPNWIEGVLKIRGSEDNVKKFMRETLTGLYEEYIPSLPNCVTFHVSEESYFKDSKRLFVTKDTDIEFDNYGDDHVYFIEVMQAWGFDIPYFVELSKKYQIDFRITGYECGMQFSHEFEIIKGTIITDISLKYDDYEWECPFPTLGG